MAYDSPPVGDSIRRKDGPDKTSGRTSFADDRRRPGLLHAAVLASPHAHAEIVGVDAAAARASSGVRGVFTGEDWKVLIGLYLGDKPPLARGRVLYHGEPVVAVVADDEASALRALRLVEVEYRPLPAIATPREALAPGAPILHPELGSYRRIPAILPEPGSNVANRTKIRKGDADRAMAAAEVRIRGEFSFPPGDHCAMEPRSAQAEILADGRVLVTSSTQSPFGVRNLLALGFGIPQGMIIVTAPAVGGGFGGKAGIQLEPLAYLLSRALGGRPVRLANTRENDMLGSPGRPGMEARVSLGAKRDGTLLAADIEFLFDSGGYADYAVNVSRAAGYACTGPYRIPNVKSDSLCVYTNHPFATAFRGFGHIEMAFCIERAMDILAAELGMDPVELRLKNAVLPGDTTPSGSRLDASTGDLPRCIRTVAARLGWESAPRGEARGDEVRAKGISCFWKAPAIPTFTDAGAIVSFNEDGSLNVLTGVVELGQGALSGLAQIAAGALGIDLAKIHVAGEVSTDRSPHDWTTAASRSLFMAGRALLAAIDDAKAQLRRIASQPLRCPEEDLEVSGGRVFVRDDPEISLALEELVLGYVYPGGNAIGGPVIGRGSYIARGLSDLDPETGSGRPGLEWTLGAEGVEVELEKSTGRFRVLRSACCMDVGRVVNPALARGQAVGAMAMGIGFATRESFAFGPGQNVVNGSLRDYKLMRFGEEPEYFVDFLETPQGDGPMGARGLGEQGILGMPGAIAQALSRAAGAPIRNLPITPETLWRSMRAGSGGPR
jgi:CO/xanthine dehydrogenase Mo-binding subunit